MLLDRHGHGAWGEVPEAEQQANEGAVQHGFRILSASPPGAGNRLWMLTEAERSATILALPDED